ncbi:MAG: hypothetical protein AAGJ10_01500 [Bacteroidota bacterium]
MTTIADALRPILSANDHLRFGLSYRLYNLTQLANYLHPLVEARTQKPVRPSAIVTALSRIQRDLTEQVPDRTRFQIDNVGISSGLTTATFFKEPSVHQQIGRVAEHFRAQGGFFHFTESTYEITVFYDDAFAEHFAERVLATPKYVANHVACVSVRFSERYMDTPGLLFALMQQIHFQRINLIDISSTFTEFNFYVAEDQVRTVFNTLHDSFLSRRPRAFL